MKAGLPSSRQRASAALGGRQRSVGAWQDRIRNPSLTALLVFELLLIFVAAPLGVRGLRSARPVGETLVLAMLVIVVMLSQRRGALMAILLGLTSTLASLSFGTEWSPIAASVLRRGGNILTFSAPSWVVAQAVYAPGRITFHRLQGAVVVYLNLGLIFASAFSLIWELSPAGFANLPAATGGPGELATMLYFQPHHSHHDRLRRYRGDRSIRPQPSQFGVGPRAALPCDHRRPPRDIGTGRPETPLNARSLV